VEELSRLNGGICPGAQRNHHGWGVGLLSLLSLVIFLQDQKAPSDGKAAVFHLGRSSCGVLQHSCLSLSRTSNPAEQRTINGVTNQ